MLKKSSVLIGDANKGYKNWENIQSLAKDLNTLNQYGLNALEDPAVLTTDQWKVLQEMVGKLDLVPDYPLRPASSGIEVVEQGMGRIYNLHPSTMAQFTDLAVLVSKIKGFGGEIMIGDDSLVGPGCNAWQQIAVGAEAVWVEALEKKGDSDSFIPTIISKPMTMKNGVCFYDPAPGFGLVLNEDKLKSIAKEHLEW